MKASHANCYIEAKIEHAYYQINTNASAGSSNEAATQWTRTRVHVEVETEALTDKSMMERQLWEIGAWGRANCQVCVQTSGSYSTFERTGVGLTWVRQMHSYGHVVF